MYSISKQILDDKEYTFIEIEQKNIRVTFMDYGATIMSIFVPDINGKMESVVMAYGALKSYLNNNMYLNAIIGPTSGRIAEGKFKIDNTAYQLDTNIEGTENLHGGKETFAFRFFSFEIEDNLEYTKVVFTIKKSKENSNYPGNQTVKIIYTVREKELQIEFTGSTDEDALMNLTNHMYFNLSGNMKRDILDNELYVDSENHLDLDEFHIPSKVAQNKNTIFDFSSFRKIKNNFPSNVYSLISKGIDEPYLLAKKPFDHLKIHLKDNISKRELKIYTNYPCAVIYTHNFPNKLELLYNAANKRHMGICFETQLVPNAINLENFDKGILRKNDVYNYKTLYKFVVGEDKKC